MSERREKEKRGDTRKGSTEGSLSAVDKTCDAYTGERIFTVPEPGLRASRPAEPFYLSVQQFSM
jgi:hypothetical protein